MAQAFKGSRFMRSIAGGVSAGGSLALAHHFLSLIQPSYPDLLTACNTGDHRWDGWSFGAGVVAGILLVLGIQIFVTLRWAFITFVQLHLGAASVVNPPDLARRSTTSFFDG